MLPMSEDMLPELILAVALVLMALVNCYTLFRMMPNIASEGADISQLVRMMNLTQGMVEQLLSRHDTDLADPDLGWLEQARDSIIRLRHQRDALSPEAAEELHSLRQERARYLRERETLQRELTSTTERLEQALARLQEDAEATRDLLQTVQRDKLAVEQAHAQLLATHERTVQEKLFIEEAFMKIDRHLEMHQSASREVA